MQISLTSRPTLSVVEADIGDEILFTRSDGSQRRIEVQKSWAGVHSSTLQTPKVPECGAHTVVRAHVNLVIDGVAVSLIRWIGDDRSFAEPYQLFGLNLWFDGNQDIFEHINENHGSCRPRKRVRLAIWEQGSRICPTLLHPWCPLPEDGLRISDCYDSDDCWMGAYHGADAHGGLDINHPAGTTLYTPLAFHRQGFFNHLRDGDPNNRWRGEVDWPDGSRWALQVHHLIALLVDEDQPLLAGQPYALAAGMYNGMYEHSHFVFAVRGSAEDEEIRCDPWLLFRQMLRDRQAMLAPRRAGRIERATPIVD